MSRRRSPIDRDGLRLSGLLGASAELTRAPEPEPESEVFALVAQLRPGLGQPRREFNDEKLLELAQSIEKHGVLQPLLVRIAGDGNGYEIIAGERRWRASQLAGITEVPVVVRDISDQEARHLALIENLQREDLNMVDEVDAKLELIANTLGLSREEARARLMQLLREEKGPDHQTLEELFATLGETWSNFAKTKLRILNWPRTILEAVRGGLPYTLAGVIVGAPEAEHMQLLEKARQGASRVELKAEVQRLKAKGQGEKPRAFHIGKVLSSRKWATSLEPQEEKEVEEWLAQMPEAVRRALGRS
ncbi:ParB/RepB/Spo0J family partition protein [Deinococcus sp. SL84]|uniref:ParB/RepB/Spo0J family partition protein n=1 Tax=Deinococcus sp. SL84 TaxID=2994663 RepID=UPI002274D08B|nr:ParB/RepB/Spo0J family partition protein [Deinococcus sp. SL84]MCY1703712.1 ParB/RepB/Spo0J family partition protein [Deinococcus sp. SL84]